MRWIISLRTILLIPIWVVSVQAQSDGIALSDGLSIPSCVLECGNVTSEVTACMARMDVCGECRTAFTQPVVMQCLQSACTPRDLLTNLNTQSVLCRDPVRTKTNKYRTTITAFFAVAVVAIFLRYLTHFTISHSNWIDLVLLGVILVLDTGFVAVCISMTYLGLGRDMWVVSQDDISPTLLYFWVGQIIYILVIGLIKILVLRFFLNIFPAERFRLCVWVCIGFLFCFSVGFAFLSAFGCTPVSLAWERWDGLHQGHCLNINVFAYIHAGISIAMDFVTLALPVTQIWKLQMSTRRKIAVVLMFSVGIFVTIVSILRLKALVNFANTTNVTWDNVEASLWSNIEVQVGIICACMPAMRLGLVTLFPKIKGHSYHLSRPSGTGLSGSTFPRREWVADQNISVTTSVKITGGKRPSINDRSSFVPLDNMEGYPRTTGARN